MEIKLNEKESKLNYLLTMDEKEFEEFAIMVSSANLTEKRNFAPSVRYAKEMADKYRKGDKS